MTTADIQPLLSAYDDQMRGAPPTPPAGGTYEQDGPLLRTVGQFRGLVSGPRDLGVDGGALDELIARQRDFFAARGEAVEWKTRSHDTPANLTERLRAAGFVPEERETVLVGRAAEMALWQPAPPEGVTVRRVTADADMRRIAAMESAVWGEDWSWLADDLIGRVGTAPDDIAVYVAEADGEVVCAEWRGRGIYRALVAVRAALAVSRGVTYLHVDASDDSAPILRRLGMHAVTTTTPYVWTPAVR
jgi:GNAT superfamily N-acetyltransferase